MSHQYPVRITPEAAAIAAIQSAAPRLKAPVPQYRFYSVKSTGLVFYGGGIDGGIAIDKDRVKLTDVRDEVTSRRSASEFCSYINRKRRVRSKAFSSYWKHKLEFTDIVLGMERQAFQQAQVTAPDSDSSGEESPHKRVRTTAIIPLIRSNVGAFDEPLPPPVEIPDPRELVQTSVESEVQLARLARMREMARR